MTFFEMRRAWQRRARAFTNHQLQRRAVQQQQRLLLEGLEDRLVLSNGLSSPVMDSSVPAALTSVQSPPPAPAGSPPSLNGSWSELAPSPFGGVGTMLLLPNGSVMAQGGGVTNSWSLLTPDAGGNYANGTWSALASMSRPRLYFGSVVLGSDQVFVLGGEYSTNGGIGTWDNTGEIYNIAANTWSSIPNFPQSNFGDDPTAVLPSGQILAGYLSGPQTYLYNPSTNSWSNGPTKLDGDSSDEETWVKLPSSAALPHGGILSYSIFASDYTNSFLGQVYNIATNTWMETKNSTSNPPPLLSSSSIGEELGGGLLLPNGKVFQIGANGNTALYDPNTNTWSAGPQILDSTGVLCGADDAPASILPDGQVVFAADTGPTKGTFAPPTELFDYDYNTNTLAQITNLPTNLTTDLTFSSAYVMRSLVLPSGQLLFSDGGSLFVFTPSDGPQNAWRPSIASVANQGNGAYTLMGTQLSDISEGSSYGDDVNVAENYPIVQLTASNGNVYYPTTSNWSSVGVSNVSDLTLETVNFTLPTGLSIGHYQLSVITNGIASKPQDFIVSDNVLTAAKLVSTPFSINDQTVTLSAAVTDDNQSSQIVSEGTVTFTVKDSSGAIVGPPVQGNVSGGTAIANFTLPANEPAGPYTVAVSYSDSNGIFLDDGTDSTAALTINPASVKVAGGLLTTPFSTHNQIVTLGALITDDNYTSDTVGEGTVTFTVKDGSGNTVGSPVQGNVSGGMASANFTLAANAPAGPYTVAVRYSDSQGNFADDAADNTGTLAVNAAQVKVAGTPLTTPFSSHDQAVTLNALVTDDSYPSDTVGAGTVTFTVKDSKGNAVGSPVQGSVSGGVASANFTLPANAPAGSYTVAVSYSDSQGNFADDGTDGTGTLAVHAANVKVAGSPLTTPFSTHDQTVTLSALVTDDSYAADTVGEGIVTFTVKDGKGNTVGSPVQGSVSGGTATANFTLPANAPAGLYTVAVSYSDNQGNFADTNDNNSTLTTTPANVTVMAASVLSVYSPNTTSVSVSAAVANNSYGNDAVNEGVVTFTIKNGSSIVGAPVQAAVVGGQAATHFNLPGGQAIGNYTIAVSYSDSQGNFTDTGDTSATLRDEPAGVTTTAGDVSAVYSPNTQSITVNATLADSTLSRDTVGEGTVAFTLLDGSTVIGTPVQANVDAGNANTRFSLPAGQAPGNYTLQVSYTDTKGNFLDQGDTNATLIIQSLPLITTKPIDQTVNAGDSATFTAEANGNPTPTVQWQVSSDNGKTWTDLSNATGTTLTLSNVSFALNGNQYRAVFSNSLGDTASSAASLTVDTPAAITSGNSTVFTVGQSGSFLVTTTGFPAPTLTVSGTLPSGVLLINAGNGTAILGGTPASGANGTYTFTIKAHNGVGNDFTQSFTLTVNAAPPTPVSASSLAPSSSHQTPVLKVPPLLALLDELLGGVETLNTDGTATITDNLFGLPPLVSTYDSSGNLVSVTLFGFNLTFLFV